MVIALLVEHVLQGTCTMIETKGTFIYTNLHCGAVRPELFMFRVTLVLPYLLSKTYKTRLFQTKNREICFPRWGAHKALHEKTGFLPMRKKGTGQLCTADQRLWFRYLANATHLLPNSDVSSF